jgi:hypothetical protein
VQNLLCCRLQSKNLKIKIYRIIILPVDLYECETWSLTLREGRRLRVFEKRVLRRIFGPKRDEVTAGEWRKLHNEGLHDVYTSPNIVRVLKSRRMTWFAACSAVWGRGETCIGFWCGNLRRRLQWGDPGVGGRIMLGWIFRRWDVGLWTGLGWFRMEKVVNAVMNKTLGISRLATNRLASQEGLCSMEYSMFVSY